MKILEKTDFFPVGPAGGDLAWRFAKTASPPQTGLVGTKVAVNSISFLIDSSVYATGQYEHLKLRKTRTCYRFWSGEIDGRDWSGREIGRRDWPKFDLPGSKKRIFKSHPGRRKTQYLCVLTQLE